MLIPIARGGFLPLLLASFAVGVFLGALYDVLRIRRAAFRLSVGRPARESGFRAFVRRHLWAIDGWLCFVEDLLFFLFGTVVFILVAFKLYFGIPRWYAYGAALLGAILYRVTLGRLVMSVSERLIRFTVSAFRFVRDRVILPPCRVLRRRLETLREALRQKRAIAFTEAEEAAALAVFAGLTDRQNDTTKKGC